MTVNAPTIVDGDFGYWRSASGHVRIERLAPGEVDLSVAAGDTGLFASLTIEEAAELMEALRQLVSLGPSTCDECGVNLSEPCKTFCTSKRVNSEVVDRG